MKDLKKEYEEMILPDIPDLWDRIEAALPMEEETPAPIKPFKKAKIYRWSTVIAACLCVFIILPVALMGGRGCGSEYAASDSAPAAMDEGMEYMEEAVAEDTTVTNGFFAESQLNNIDGATYGEDYQECEPKTESTFETDDVSFTDIVAVQFTETITENGEIIGYRILIKENTTYFSVNDRIDVYFSAEIYADNFSKTINMEDIYVVEIHFNAIKNCFEIMNLQ